MILPEARTPSDEARFLSEALATGDLDHPNIVPVHDLGRDAEGNLFMAMKLVHGSPWDKLLYPENGDKPRSIRDHLEILIKVCDGIAFAHSRGIVHRDLKPENVMVGDFGEVLVMDWGIAVDVSDAPHPYRKAESLAETSPRAGTIAYMAPEVARGSRARIGPATDVYLLGGILYEILTGTPPHLAESVTEGLKKAAAGVVPPPEERAPERSIPRELSRIAMKALAVDPDDRYPGAVSFREELRAYLAHEESLRLADEAGQKLEKLRAPGAVPRAERYALYSAALGELAQALHLWSENAPALDAQARALADYADEALDRGDVGLAAAQVAALAKSPRADRRRLEAQQAAITARSASRLRAVLIAVALLGALVLGYRVSRGWSDELSKPTVMREAARKAAIPIWHGWRAARAGSAAGVESALADVAREPNRPWRKGDAVSGLRWAREVLLWREGRWAELVDSLAARDEGATEPADLAGRIQARAEVKGTPLAERLAAKAPRDEGGPVGDRAPAPAKPIWTIVAEQARRGLPPAAIGAAIDELQKSEPAPPATEFAPAFPDLARRRAALRAAAVWAIAHEAARDAEDETAAAACAAHLVPYRLAAPPFGPAIASNTAPPVVISDGASGVVALDPVTRAERWRFAMAESSRASAVAVPVEDGSVILVARGEMLRLDGSDGRVLARAFTDGDGLLAFPDPLDRARVVAIVSTDWDMGYVHEVRYRAGAAETLITAPDYVTEVSPSNTRAAGVRDRLLAEARKGDDQGSYATRAIAALRGAAEREPATPGLWISLLEAAEKKLPEPQRAEIAQKVTAEGMPPMLAVSLGTRLEKAGFRAEADRIYERAAGVFLDRLGNVDIAPGWSNPSLLLRQRGGEIFATDPERALALIERGRAFSSYLEQDHGFYRRYASWLRAQGRTEELAKIEPRVKESVAAGGPFILPVSYQIGLDIALALALFLPPILLVLVVRSYWRARATRIADLYALGFRTGRERLAAFVTQPVLRVSHTFLAYATRWERLLLVVLAALFLASASVASQRIKSNGRQAVLPSYLSQGYAGSDGMVRAVEDRIAERGPAAPSLRLLSEGYFARGDLDRAERRAAEALAIAPGHAGTRNNLALLVERAGRMDEARRGYQEAAQLSGDGAAVARWNLARLDRDAAASRSAEAAMARRDRLAAEHLKGSAPLWARCPFDDLQAHLLPTSTLASEILGGMPEMIAKDFIEIGGLMDIVDGLTAQSPFSATRWMSALKGYGSLVVGFFALLLLPLSPRPLSAEKTEKSDRLALWKKRSVYLSLPAAVVPGAWELLRGRIAVGAAMLLALALSGAVVLTVRLGGALGHLIEGAYPLYFTGVKETVPYPDLLWAANLATAVIGALYLIAIALAIRGILAARRAQRTVP
jgi:hypothetical protein